MSASPERRTPPRRPPPPTAPAPSRVRSAPPPPTGPPPPLPPRVSSKHLEPAIAALGLETGGTISQIQEASPQPDDKQQEQDDQEAEQQEEQEEEVVQQEEQEVQQEEVQQEEVQQEEVREEERRQERIERQSTTDSEDGGSLRPSRTSSYQPLAGSEARKAWLASRPFDLDRDSIPELMRACIRYLIQPRSLKEEGLFRVPGNQAKIDALLKQVQQGVVPDLSQIREPSIVTGLLKTHLNRATNAVVPVVFQKDLATAVTNKDLQTKIAAIKKAVDKLPAASQMQLRALVWLFVQVAEEPESHMNSSVLGTSVGPSTFATMATSCAQRLLKVMIEYPAEIFG